jgi:hypothetical protein
MSPYDTYHTQNTANLANLLSHTSKLVANKATAQILLSALIEELTTSAAQGIDGKRGGINQG